MRISFVKSPVSSLKSPTNSPKRNKNCSFRGFCENLAENRENQAKTCDFLIISAEKPLNSKTFGPFPLIFQEIATEMLENTPNSAVEARFYEFFLEKPGYKTVFEPIFLENTRKLREITQDFSRFLSETQVFAEILLRNREKPQEIARKARILQVFGVENCGNLLLKARNPQFLEEKLAFFAENAHIIVFSAENAEEVRETAGFLMNFARNHREFEEKPRFSQEKLRETEKLDFPREIDVFQGISQVSLINECISE